MLGKTEPGLWVRLEGEEDGPPLQVDIVTVMPHVVRFHAVLTNFRHGIHRQHLNLCGEGRGEKKKGGGVKFERACAGLRFSERHQIVNKSFSLKGEAFARRFSRFARQTCASEFTIFKPSNLNLPYLPLLVLPSLVVDAAYHLHRFRVQRSHPRVREMPVYWSVWCTCSR